MWPRTGGSGGVGEERAFRAVIPARPDALPRPQAPVPPRVQRLQPPPAARLLPQGGRLVPLQHAGLRAGGAAGALRQRLRGGGRGVRLRRRPGEVPARARPLEATAGPGPPPLRQGRGAAPPPGPFPPFWLQECPDPCCFAHNCSLRAGAQCSRGDCCASCQVRAGQARREGGGCLEQPRLPWQVGALRPRGCGLHPALGSPSLPRRAVPPPSLAVGADLSPSTVLPVSVALPPRGHLHS